MPLAKNSVRSVAGSSAFGPVCPNGEMNTNAAVALRRRSASNPSAGTQVAGASLAHDQVCHCQRAALGHRLAVVQIGRELRGRVRLDTPDIGAHIREQPTAHRGCQAAADLHDMESPQQCHRSPVQDRTQEFEQIPAVKRNPRIPAAAAACMSVSWSPTSTQHSASSSHARIRSSSMPGAGFRQSLARR